LVINIQSIHDARSEKHQVMLLRVIMMKSKVMRWMGNAGHMRETELTKNVSL